MQAAAVVMTTTSPVSKKPVVESVHQLPVKYQRSEIGIEEMEYITVIHIYMKVLQYFPIFSCTAGAGFTKLLRLTKAGLSD